jgi:hypothetical protein
MVVEKAVAKISGSYSALSGGNEGDALKLMTGAPCLHLFVRTNETSAARDERWRGEASAPDRFTAFELNPSLLPPLQLREALFQRLLSYFEAGYLMGTSASLQPAVGSFPAAVAHALEARIAGAGIHARHSYAILRVLDARAPGGRGPRLLQLQNPHGAGGSAKSKSFSGKWSDKSAEWAHAPEALRATCAPYGQATFGIFWIELDDFVSIFSEVEVAKVRGCAPSGASRPWRTLRAELPLPTPLQPAEPLGSAVVLRLRVVGAVSVELVASIVRRRAPNAARTDSAGSPVVWRRRSGSDPGNAPPSAAVAGDADSPSDRDLALLVVEEHVAECGARSCRCSSSTSRAAQVCCEATGMALVPFLEAGTERRVPPSRGRVSLSAEVELSGSKTYYVIALSLSHIGRASGAAAASGLDSATALIEVHSSADLKCEAVSRPAEWLSRAIVAQIITNGVPTNFSPPPEDAPKTDAERAAEAERASAFLVYTHFDGGGSLFAAVNRHPIQRMTVTTSVRAKRGAACVARASARPASLIGDLHQETDDTLSPLSAQLLQAATFLAPSADLRTGTSRLVISSGGRGSTSPSPTPTPAAGDLFAPFSFTL